MQQEPKRDNVSFGWIEAKAKVSMDNKGKSNSPTPEKGDANMTSEDQRRKAKFEVYGEEMIEKEVKQSGNSGRVYLPPEWVGKNVKIIRID